jgi:uncharacterized protein YutE (UPF0331/DUF86 family)
VANAALVESLLGTLRQYVSELRAEQDIAWSDFASNLRLRRYVEHTLQIAIQCCLDIAAHIIADEGWREFNDYRDAFTVLAENGVVDREFLPVLHKMAQFRNLMVHQYVKIDQEAIFVILKKGPNDLEHFARVIANWLIR